MLSLTYRSVGCGSRWAVFSSVVLAAASLLAACGTPAPGDPADPSAATSTVKPAPRHTDTTIAERCNVPLEGDLTALAGPGGSTISVAVLGDGPRAAVFLHQTSGAGMCGFATYAVWAAKRGVRAILVDLCGWGQSRCEGSLNDDWAAQVRIPVDWARAHGGRRRRRRRSWRGRRP